METVGMILCGGFGKRLRPITETVPKPLVEISDNYTILGDYVNARTKIKMRHNCKDFYSSLQAFMRCIYNYVIPFHNFSCMGNRTNNIF